VHIYAGATNKDGETTTLMQEVRSASVVVGYCGMDENVQVNGYNFIIDWTGFTMKQMMRWNMDDLKKWQACWQASLLLLLLLVTVIVVVVSVEAKLSFVEPGRQ